MHPKPMVAARQSRKMIIERAKRGELDPVRLCEAVLDELRGER